MKEKISKDEIISKYSDKFALVYEKDLALVEIASLSAEKLSEYLKDSYLIIFITGKKGNKLKAEAIKPIGNEVEVWKLEIPDVLAYEKPEIKGGKKGLGELAEVL